MFLSAGDSPVTREVLQHMYNSLVEQVKRKVERQSFTVKNLTVGFFTIYNGKSVGSRFGEMINFKK